MTAGDRARFAELLLGLGEISDETISDMRAELYFRALEDLDLAAVETAIVAAAKTLKYFPRPAELRACLEGNPEEAEELAWLTVCRQVRTVGYYGAPRFSDPVIEAAIRDVFGSWKELCSKLPGDGPGLLMWATQFKAAYGIMRRREGRLLPGAERFKGFLK